MIKVYYGDTPNVFKVTIAIAELGLASEWVPVDIFKGEQFTPEFLAISPNNRIPAIVDTAPADGGEPISVAESGAILIYLAEKTGKLLPSEPRAKAAVVQWVMWQMSAQGPNLGQFGHFRNYAVEKLPYAIERFGKESRRLYKLLDTRLAGREFVAGDYSIADIMCWPWLMFREHHGLVLEEFPNLARWYHTIEARPAVRAALQGSKVPPPPTFTAESRELLFNQRAE